MTSLMTVSGSDFITFLRTMPKRGVITFSYVWATISLISHLLIRKPRHTCLRIKALVTERVGGRSKGNFVSECK